MTTTSSAFYLSLRKPTFRWRPSLLLFVRTLPLHIPDHQPKPLVLRFAFALILAINLLLGFTVFQQGRTIESQGKLIHSLMHDSLELQVVRTHLLQQKN
jgi:hypothetical protein